MSAGIWGLSLIAVGLAYVLFLGRWNVRYLVFLASVFNQEIPAPVQAGLVRLSKIGGYALIVFGVAVLVWGF